MTISSISEPFIKERDMGLTKGKYFTCTLCEKTISGTQQYLSHLIGRQHKKKLERIKPNLATHNIIQSKGLAAALPFGHLRCSLCKIICNSTKSYKIHVDGLKHKKNLSALELADFVLENSQNTDTIEHSLPSTIAIIGAAVQEEPAEQTAVIQETSEGAAEIDKKTTDQGPGITNLDPTKFIGIEFIKACRNPEGEIVNYKCALCQLELPTIYGVSSHLGGRKHRQKYKLQVNNSFVVEPKSAKRTKKKKREKEIKKKAKEEFWKQNDEHLELKRTTSPAVDAEVCTRVPEILLKRYFVNLFGINNCRCDLKETMRSPSSNDEHFMMKYEMVRKDEGELEFLLWFCDVCENALKLVSDEFLIRSGHTADDDRRRLLRGTMRVGILCHMQIVKEDRDFRMVLLISSKPTLDLLEMIHLSLLPHLEKSMELRGRDASVEYEVTIVPEAACLLVNVVSPFQFNVCISLTSQLFDEVEVAIKVKEEKEEEDALLCVDSCKESLQQLKRADYFQARPKCLNEGLKVLTVLRHLRLEGASSWSAIDEWANALLVEKCMFIQGLNARPMDILRCYLELLSSGLLFDGPGLLDPCEDAPVDVLRNVTPQSREDITLHAQKCLRCMAFGRSYEFLNIPDFNPKKRKLPSDSNLAPKSKKKPG